MELPALKVGKPRPTPVVRGGITEMLMSLEPGDVESDSKIADAISLCQQVAEKFSEL